MAKEVQRVGVGGRKKIRVSMYLDEGEIKEVIGNLLFQLLDDSKLNVGTTFTSNCALLVFRIIQSSFVGVDLHHNVKVAYREREHECRDEPDKDGAGKDGARTGIDEDSYRGDGART
ncbi:hypothetical protein LIER_24727 [Lithospermum erythrorhizon]|uniref:Uncharacterized protein n=1 Tax=Lithospermum erythrorhizon TaxID=34254 RepID=A0AAV3R281_LITER